MNRAQLLAAIESLKAWVKFLPDGEVQPFRMSPIPGLTVAVRSGPSANAEKCKRYRQSKRDTGRDTTPTRVATPHRHGSRHHTDTGRDTVSTGVETPLSPSPPAPPSDSYLPNNPKASAVVAKEPNTFRARSPEATAAPTSFDEAVTEPLSARAAAVLGNAMLADLLRAAEWPEFLEVAGIWHEAAGLPGDPRRLTPNAVQALARLYAHPFLPSDVKRAARYVPTCEKYRGKVSLSVLTPDVVEIALGELAKGESSREAVRERLQRAGASGTVSAPAPLGETIGALTGRLASGGTT